MVSVDQAGIVDHLLWQEAQTMLGRHAAPDARDCCLHCGLQWPCTPRRLAEQAEVASRSPWREALSFRHDLNSVRATDRAGGNRRARLPAGNRRTFD
jgi:hypothetical protein